MVLQDSRKGAEAGSVEVDPTILSALIGATIAFLGGVVAYLRGIANKQEKLKDDLHAMDIRVHDAERSLRLFDELVSKELPKFLHTPTDPEWSSLMEKYKRGDLSLRDAVKFRDICQQEIDKIASQDAQKVQQGLVYILLKWKANVVVDRFEEKQKRER